MVEYDAGVIEKFAAKLYRQADSIVAIYTLLFAVCGAIGGMAIRGRPGSIVPVIGGVLVIGAIGYLVGQARAFQLRLLAQTALCQAEIERNTRATTRS